MIRQFTVDGEALDRLEDWIADGCDVTHYHGMTYEEGMRDMLDILRSTSDSQNGNDAIDSLIKDE